MADVTLNLHVDAYTNRVLGVIKEAFGLKNKSEALQKFAQMHGNDVIREQITPKFARELKAIEVAHFKKYGMRKMTLDELDKLTGV